MKKISRVKIIVDVEHDEEFDVLTELGVVQLYEREGEFVPILESDEFRIIDYIEEELMER